MNDINRFRSLLTPLKFDGCNRINAQVSRSGERQYVCYEADITPNAWYELTMQIIGPTRAEIFFCGAKAFDSGWLISSDFDQTLDKVRNIHWPICTPAKSENCLIANIIITTNSGLVPIIKDNNIEYVEPQWTMDFHEIMWIDKPETSCNNNISHDPRNYLLNGKKQRYDKDSDPNCPSLNPGDVINIRKCTDTTYCWTIINVEFHRLHALHYSSTDPINILIYSCGQLIASTGNQLENSDGERQLEFCPHFFCKTLKIVVSAVLDASFQFWVDKTYELLSCSSVPYTSAPLYHESQYIDFHISEGFVGLSPEDVVYTKFKHLYFEKHHELMKHPYRNDNQYGPHKIEDEIYKDMEMFGPYCDLNKLNIFSIAAGNDKAPFKITEYLTKSEPAFPSHKTNETFEETSDILPEIYSEKIEHNFVPTTFDIVDTLKPQSINEIHPHWFNQNHWILVIKKEIDHNSFENDIKQMGIFLLHDYEHLDHYIIEGSFEQIEELRKDDRVLLISQNSVISISACNEESLNLTWDINKPTHNWGLYTIAQLDLNGYPNRVLPNQKYTWTKDGFDVDVVILDSGVNFYHSEFKSKHTSTLYDVRADTSINSTAPFYERILTKNPDYGNDCCGHGTHVAGIIGGNKYGVAKGVNLLSAKIFIRNTSLPEKPYYSETVWALHALNTIVTWHKEKIQNRANRPSIINISVGTDDPATVIAFQNCIDHGIVICGAAGNSGKDLGSNPLFPAIISDALTVGAIDPELSNYLDTDGNLLGIMHKVSAYSNYGSVVDVFAPGTNIVSADYSHIEGSKMLSGTSQAAPFVTGVLAQWLQGRNIAKDGHEAKQANIFIETESSLKNRIILLDQMKFNTKNLLLISPFICLEPVQKIDKEIDLNLDSVKQQIQKKETKDQSSSQFTNVAERQSDAQIGPEYEGYGPTQSTPYGGGQNYNVDNIQMQIIQSNQSKHNIVNHSWDPNTIVKKDAYKTNSYQIWAKSNGTVGSNGDMGSVVDFEVVLNDIHADRAYYDNVTGTTTTYVYLQKSLRIIGAKTPAIATITTPSDPYIEGADTSNDLGHPDEYKDFSREGGFGGGGGGGAAFGADTTDYKPSIIFNASFLDQYNQTTIVANWESEITFNWNMQSISSWTTKTEVIGGNCYFNSVYPNTPFDWFHIGIPVGTYTTNGALPVCMRAFNGCELKVTITAHDTKTDTSVSASVIVYLTTVCKCPEGMLINQLNNTCELSEYIDPDAFIGPYLIIPSTMFNDPTWCLELQEYGVWISEDGLTPHQLLYQEGWLAIGIFYDVPRAGTYTFKYSADNEALLWINGEWVDSWGDYTTWHSFTINLAVGNQQYFEFRFKNDLQAPTAYQIFSSNPGVFGALIFDDINNQIFNTRTSKYILAPYICASLYVPDLKDQKCYQYSSTPCLSNEQSLTCNAYLPSPKMYAYGWQLNPQYTGTSAYGSFGERALTYRGNRPKLDQVIGQKFWGMTGWSIFDPSTYLLLNPDINTDIEGKVYGYFYTATDHFIDHGAFEGLFGRCFANTNVSGPQYKCPCLVDDDTNRSWGWRYDSNGVLHFRSRKATPQDIEGAIFNTTLGTQYYTSLSFARSNPDVQWIINHGNFGLDIHGKPLPKNLKTVGNNAEYFIERGAWESVAFGRCLNYMGNEVRDVGGYVDDYHNQVNNWSLMKHNKINARYLSYEYHRATHENVLNGSFWTQHGLYDTFTIDEYLRINPDVRNIFTNGRWLDGHPLPKGYSPIDHFIDYGAFEGQFYRNFNG